MFDRVLKAGRASLDDLMAGVARYAAERTDEEPQYTKHPKTWLNGGHWADEPAPRPDISRGAAPRQWSRPDNAATTLLKRDRMEREAHDNHDPFDDQGAHRRPHTGGGPDRVAPSERGRMGGARSILDLEPIRSDRK
ncbi:hypothetical protein ASF34_01320 [Methylobacterium sp. Leaf106]|nr:hypothetical protein ASF34_01320 [Methylobacterium sp. Leaf106]